MSIHATANSTARHFEVHPEVRRIGEAIVENGGMPYLVGGWVRDRLLGLAGPQDYDLEVFQLSMRRLEEILLPFGPVHSVGRHFGVLKLATKNAAYDVSVPRRESNIGKGHKGFRVTPDPTMTFDEAAARRDFTINAMGYDFQREVLLDPHGGERDLAAGLLRHVGPAFSEDPLRVLRAMRFAGRFGFRIAPETQALCRRLNLAELPRERIWEEIKKLLLQSPRPSQGFGYASKLGVLKYFPELQALHDAAAPEGAPSPWEMTLAFLDQAAIAVRLDPARGGVLMTAALCFGLTRLDGVAPDNTAPDVTAPDATAPDATAPDAAAPDATAPVGAEPEGAAEAVGPSRAGLPAAGESSLVAQFLGRLTNETRFIEGVMGLTAELVKVQALFKTRDRAGDGEVRRLALRIEIPFLLKAASALHRARQGEAAFPAGSWLESRARALGVWEGPPEPLLQGRHLLKHGLKAGRAMGNLLDAVFQLQLDGTIATREAALAWVAGHADEAQWEKDAPPGGVPTGGAPPGGGGKPSGGGDLAGKGDKP